MTPDEMSAALKQAESVFEQRMEAALRVVDPILGATATDRYMGKDLGGRSSKPNPRSGPGTLRKQTGRLARSLTSTRGRIANTGGAGEGIARITTEGAVVTLTKGSRVPYAKLHEEGGTHQVAAHERTITQAFGQPLDPPKTVQVSAHSRTVPARPYLEPALDDTRDQATKVILDTAVKAMQEIIQRAS